jgi:hypothetical protein
MTIITFGPIYLGIDDYKLSDIYYNQNQGTLTMHYDYYRLELVCPLIKRQRGPTY